MNIRTNLRRLAVTTVAASTLFAATQTTAFAADDTNVVLIAGSLSVTNPSVANFTGVTLNGTAQTTTATFDAFSASDLRGTGAGWNVTVQGTRFTDAVSTKQLDLGSLSMPAPTVASPGTTSADPAITGGPYAIDAATAVKIASATADTGMGTYDFTQGGALTLSIPASAYAGTYSSTLTVSVVSGP